MCGDSTSIDDIDKLLNKNKIDMIYTDPPYGMNLDTDFSGMKNNLDFAKEKSFTGGKKYDAGIVDDFNPEMINIILSLNVKETFLWGADYFAELLLNKNDGSWIVWDKRANGNDDIEEDYSSDKMYGSCFELCWSKNKHKRDIARVKWAGVFGTEQEFDHKRYHPTQKPIKLSSWFLNRYSKEGTNILDLFGGSGSTLIACEQLNRNCYMMELDPKYIDIIINRWENFTGKKAILLNGEK
jgi:DNA modification methylase